MRTNPQLYANLAVNLRDLHTHGHGFILALLLQGYLTDGDVDLGVVELTVVGEVSTEVVV